MSLSSKLTGSYTKQECSCNLQVIFILKSNCFLSRNLKMCFFYGKVLKRRALGARPQPPLTSSGWGPGYPPTYPRINLLPHCEFLAMCLIGCWL